MMNDLISRQAAIDALMEILDRPNHAEFLYTDEICKALKALPSAQPEIIRCKDCKYRDEKWIHVNRATSKELQIANIIAGIALWEILAWVKLIMTQRMTLASPTAFAETKIKSIKENKSNGRL